MLNTFFDKIYCINLDERVDRWENVQKEFDKLGITNIERFSAIKNENGQIGCRDSHINIIKKAKEEGLKNVLIFEDDMLVADCTQINKSLTDLKSLDWDLFYLGANVENHAKVEKKSDNLIKTNFAYGGHAYAVNSRMFDYILEYGSGCNIIDVFYSDEICGKMGEVYIAKPMCCIQQVGYSNIENKNVDYSWMVGRFNFLINKL